MEGTAADLHGPGENHIDILHPNAGVRVMFSPLDAFTVQGYDLTIGTALIGHPPAPVSFALRRTRTRLGTHRVDSFFHPSPRPWWPPELGDIHTASFFPWSLRCPRVSHRLTHSGCDLSDSSSDMRSGRTLSFYILPFFLSTFNCPYVALRTSVRGFI